MTIQNDPSPAPTAVLPNDADPQRSAVDLEERGVRGDISFSFKVRASGHWYRVEPARWPGQPRFWGFRVFRCKAGNLPDPTQRAWFGAGGMTRADLPAAALAIRADVDGWLARAEHAELRRWVLEG